ncbi:Kinesin-like protein kif23 [Rhizophlyctis rosea]|nr:Kinesin-like protein kif23 [Rhizophlyctis rosea]
MPLAIDAVVESPAAAVEVELGPPASLIVRHGFEIEDGDADLICGCCYGDYVITQMTQCEDEHLFRLKCARSTAENVIGLRRTKNQINGFQQLPVPFCAFEIKRFLSDEVIEGHTRFWREKDIKQYITSSLIAVVDLAGAERSHLSGIEGQGHLETKDINQGLHTLSMCVEALRENQKKTTNRRVVPWRGLSRFFIAYAERTSFNRSAVTRMMLISLSRMVLLSVIAGWADIAAGKVMKAGVDDVGFLVLWVDDDEMFDDDGILVVDEGGGEGDGI